MVKLKGANSATLSEIKLKLLGNDFLKLIWEIISLLEL